MFCHDGLEGVRVRPKREVSDVEFRPLGAPRLSLAPLLLGVSVTHPDLAAVDLGLVEGFDGGIGRRLGRVRDEPKAA